MGGDLEDLAGPRPFLRAAAGRVLGELGPGVAGRRGLVLECVLDAGFEGGGDVAHGGLEVLAGDEEPVQCLDHLAVVVLDGDVHAMVPMREGRGVGT